MTASRLTTTQARINRDHPAARLYEKAKKLGIWNPSEIDLSRDREDWLALTTDEQRILLHLAAMFQAGEEAVTLDLLPLVMTVAAEGRLEEEMFLTTFLFEEAKHTDFFDRFLREVVGHEGPLEPLIGPSYRTVFYESLPNALKALQNDPSAEAQIRASVTYNLIVEGVLAETGYHGFFSILEQNHIMPGTIKAIRLLKQDESRHIAYGIFLLSRLIAEDDARWDLLETEMNTLLFPAIAVIGEIFDGYNPIPFNLKPEDFAAYASNQFDKRLQRIEKARNQSLDDIFKAAHRQIDLEED